MSVGLFGYLGIWVFGYLVGEWGGVHGGCMGFEGFGGTGGLLYRVRERESVCVCVCARLCGGDFEEKG